MAVRVAVQGALEGTVTSGHTAGAGAAGVPRQRGRTGHAVVDLIDHARGGLAQAAGSASAGERYAAAHLAALRAGAAVLAARSRPRTARRRRGRSSGPRNVWVDLAHVAPELAEWAEYFAAGAAKRAAAQAGLPRAVTARQADDMLRDADAFLGLVCVLLGLPHQEPLSGAAVGLAS
jgi:hypothetical protein